MLHFFDEHSKSGNQTKGTTTQKHHENISSYGTINQKLRIIYVFILYKFYINFYMMRMLRSDMDTTVRYCETV